MNDNFILENEHHPRAIHLDARPVNRTVRTVVVTRYCVLHEPSSLGDPYVWLGHRLGLFTRFMLPSMLGQRHTPDLWVLLVSEVVADHVTGQLSGLLPPWAVIQRVPAGRAHSLMLNEHNTGRWTVAARIDNDDAVAADYVHGFAQYTHLAKPGRALLSYPYGAQWNAGVLRSCASTTGHFSAVVIPPGGDLSDSLAYNHTDVYRGGLNIPVRQLVTTMPMWVEVQHDLNVANRPRPGVRVTVPPERFNI